jgi:hypothetical protein
VARIGARNIEQGDGIASAVSGVTAENTIDPRNIVYTENGNIEPAEGTAETATVEPVRKRGRPAGSKNGTSKTNKAIPVDVNSITFSLTGIHALLAAGLSAPELMMTEDEGKIIGNAAAAVARHYDLQASQKAIDWGNLCVALSAFYGPRVMAISVRRKQERAEKRQQQQPGVVAQPVSAARPPGGNGAAKPTGAPLRTHTPSEAEKVALLNETVTPMFQ